MKTEQEMTSDKIKKGLEYCADINLNCNDCPYDAVGNCNDILSADALNLITEQEKEIEQLKAENDTNMQYIRMMGIQNHIKTSNERVKQAKIDVLNFLKNGYEVDISTSNDCDMVVRVDDIDELIEELQNGEDKG